MGRIRLVERARRLLVLLALTVACSSGSAEPRVFAAASLTDVLTELGDAEYVFDGSFSLVRQLRDGAPADVLVTADPDSMSMAVGGKLVEEPVVFARNRLVVVVPPGNPAGVRTVRDLGRVRLALATGGSSGRYATEMFRRAGLSDFTASEETSVRAVLAKVALREADAGVVFRTDVTDGVDTVEIPPNLQVVVEYHAAAVTARGRDFVESLRSDRGRALLDRYGFLPP